MGIKLPATYADPEVWKQTNQKGAQLSAIFGPIISVVSLCFYFAGAPEIEGIYIAIGLIAAMVITIVYLYFYSSNLLQKTLAQPGAASLPMEDTVGISKVNVISLLVTAIAFVVVGILLIYSHAGTSIGIRVGNVFRDAATWHRVNTVGGIGDIVIGAFFAVYFARFISGVKNPRAFYRVMFSFFAAIILWSIVSAIYAYHV
jgi:uncharacterized membrane protein